MVGYRIAGLVLLLFQVKVLAAECDFDTLQACVNYYPPFPDEGLPTREECSHFTAGTEMAALCINRYTDCDVDVLWEAARLLAELQLDTKICELVTNRCYNDSCENNAACMEEETGPFVCLCSHEYTGATCQTKITTAVTTVPTVTPDPTTAVTTVPTVTPDPTTATTTVPTVTPDPETAATNVPTVTPDPTGSAATSTDAPSSLTLPLAVGVSVSLSVVLVIAVTLAVRRCQSGAPTKRPYEETINPAYDPNRGGSDRDSVSSVTDTYYQEIDLPDSPDDTSGRPTSGDLGLANVMPCQDFCNDLGNNLQASHAEGRIGTVV